MLVHVHTSLLLSRHTQHLVLCVPDFVPWSSMKTVVHGRAHKNAAGAASVDSGTPPAAAGTRQCRSRCRWLVRMIDRLRGPACLPAGGPVAGHDESEAQWPRHGPWDPWGVRAARWAARVRARRIFRSCRPS